MEYSYQLVLSKFKFMILCPYVGESDTPVFSVTPVFSNAPMRSQMFVIQNIDYSKAVVRYARVRWYECVYPKAHSNSVWNIPTTCKSPEGMCLFRQRIWYNLMMGNRIDTLIFSIRVEMWHIRDHCIQPVAIWPKAFEPFDWLPVGPDRNSRYAEFMLPERFVQYAKVFMRRKNSRHLFSLLIDLIREFIETQWRLGHSGVVDVINAGGITVKEYQLFKEGKRKNFRDFFGYFYENKDRFMDIFRLVHPVASDKQSRLIWN
jgi:hypothetical protein